MNTELNKLERSVLNKLLAGDHPVLEALRHQLLIFPVKSRKLTGVGFFTHFVVDQGLAAAPTRAKRLWFGDVNAEVPSLAHGIGFLILITDGYLDMLEAYTYDEPWPVSVDEFTLSYTGGSRDIESLKLDGS